MATDFNVLEARQLIAREQSNNKVRLGGKPETNQGWINLADDLLRWALKPSTKNIKDFAVERHYSFGQLNRWANDKKTYDYFREVWEAVFDILDAKRDKPLLNPKHKDYFNYIKLTKPMYDSVLRILNKEEEQEKQVPTVITKYLFAEKENDAEAAPVVEEGK